MLNGKKEKEIRTRIMRNGNERKSSSSSPQLDCEVGLGLKMQLQPTGDASVGDGPFFSSTSNRLACVNDIYEVADGVVVQRTFHNTALRASGGMPVPGKALFTASQWQELERQKMIHKYILACVPVPSQLLLPTTTSPAPPSLSQCNTSGLDLRFTASGTDPEPWRCKRTDGKKWRCSRDVAPDQKYCERHAHKNRPRSRKHVEVSSSHNISNTYNSQKSLIFPPDNNPTANFTTQQPLPRSTSQFPTVTESASYDETRCIEWFMRGGSSSSSRSGDTDLVSSCKQQWEQVVEISPSASSRLEMNRDNTTEHNKNVPVYQPHFKDKQGFMSLNPYIPDATRLENHNHNHNHNQLSNGQSCNSILGVLSLDAAADRLTQTTRHFIDAWGKEGFDGISRSKEGGSSASLSKKFSPSSSLSLSMSGGNHDDDLGIGVIHTDRDRDSDGILKPPQWVNPVSWMNSSPPGGPLGEALCLGNATVTRGSSKLASPHGYSNSNTNANTNTNSSSGSKRSFEDGSHALNFIG